ncbi:MAG: hypothetical protein ABIS59_01505, partial [Candidatus Saccharibacteria bacterium]
IVMEYDASSVANYDVGLGQYYGRSMAELHSYVSNLEDKDNLSELRLSEVSYVFGLSTRELALSLRQYVLENGQMELEQPFRPEVREACLAYITASLHADAEMRAFSLDGVYRNEMIIAMGVLVGIVVRLVGLNADYLRVTPVEMWQLFLELDAETRSGE